MKTSVSVNLIATPEQLSHLEALQKAFARLCNELAPEVQKTRVWNRVVMHHMFYKHLREKFPDVGSQMVCNAIYAVSKTSRILFQISDSPFYVDKLGKNALPLMEFQNNCPVFFDRHTLSLNGNILSLFTLNGRIKFDIQKDNKDSNFEMLNNIQEIFLIKGEFYYELKFIYKINVFDKKLNKFKMPDYLRVERKNDK
jgi:hypothetical protein